MHCERETAKLAQRKKAENPEHNKRRALLAQINRKANPARCLWWGAKIRARRFGWAFDITREEVTIPPLCPVLGIPFGVNSKQSPNSPTLDRINNTRGYVKGNVRVISWRANSLKSDASIDEIEKVLRYMKRELAK